MDTPILGNSDIANLSASARPWSAAEAQHTTLTALLENPSRLDDMR